MGVVRYLCITILLACLVAAQDCNSNGHLNKHGDCVCDSGYDGVACANNFAFDTLFGCHVNAVAPKVRDDDRFPKLDDLIETITFRKNILKLAIAGEIVPARQYDNIVFLNQLDSKCSLNGSATTGSYWSQRNQTDLSKCRDSFVLRMPWNQWSQCGFALSTAESTTHWTYRATMTLTYHDALGKPFDIAESTYKPELTRKSSVSYKLYVRFLKTIEVEVNQLVTVNNTVGLQVAMTKFEYNPSTGVVTMGLSTIVKWPNMLLRNTMTLAIQGGANTFSFAGGLATGVPTNPIASQAENDIYCPTDKYNNCLQYYEFDIKLDSGCDFNGVYIVSATVATCRDTPLTCTSSLTQSFVQVTKSDVCGSVTAEPMIDGRLLSFDQAHNSQTEFELGYRGYFEVDINVNAANDFNLTWIDIWVVADMDVPTPAEINSVELPNIQWLFRDGAVKLDGFHKWNGGTFAPFATSPVDLKVHGVTRNANAEVVFTPKFDFLFDSRVFHIPLFNNEDQESGVKKGYTLHARGKIVYANNEQYGKRTVESEEVVEFVWKTDAAGFTGSARFALTQDAAPAAVSSNTNAVLLSLAPVAGIALAVIAAAVVAAVIIVKRKNSNTISYATLN